MRHAFLIVTELPGSASEDSYVIDEEYDVRIVDGKVPEDPKVRAAIKRSIDQAIDEGREQIIGRRRAT